MTDDLHPPPRTPAATRTAPLFAAGALAPTAVNPTPHESTRARQAPITWRDVLRVLSTDETRSRALALYRARANYTADQFQHHRPARARAVEALVAVEDWLEVAHPQRRDERLALREVRRALELEVWA